MAVDLVERLTEAAAAAIANERPDFCRDPHRIRSVVLEFSLNKNGSVMDGRCYVERRVSNYTRSEKDPV